MPLNHQDAESLALQLLRKDSTEAYSHFWDRDSLHLRAERRELGGPTVGTVSVHKNLIADYGEVAIHDLVKRLRNIVDAQAEIPDDQLQPISEAVNRESLPEPEEWKRADRHTII